MAHRNVPIPPPAPFSSAIPSTESSTGLSSWRLVYIGCLEVNASMKSIDFGTRSLIAKECIHRVCQLAGASKGKSKAREPNSRVSRMLADKPNLTHSGAKVLLTITSSYLNLALTDSDHIIVRHDMPNISFVSGGDAETLDYVAYVAKDTQYGRACFVLECPPGLAQEVITTVGQAFEMRFKQFFKRAPKFDRSEPERVSPADLAEIRPRRKEADRDYYNDLPGKVPPEFADSPQRLNVEPTTSGKISPQPTPRRKRPEALAESLVPLKSTNTTNLIDLTESTPLCNASNSVSIKPLDPLINLNINNGRRENNNSNSIPTKIECHNNLNSTNGVSKEGKDPFDMKPFDSIILEEVQKDVSFASTGGSSLSPLPTTAAQPTPIESTNGPSSLAPALAPTAVPSLSSSVLTTPLISSSSAVPRSIESERLELKKEIWFHGPITRKESESLVLRDGDFLVRELTSQVGQFVLSGMQSGVRKHLLLIDPQGKVRTKDKTFDNVSHLINFHRDNKLPIISAESVLYLRTPIRSPLHALSTSSASSNSTPTPPASQVSPAITSSTCQAIDIRP